LLRSGLVTVQVALGVACLFLIYTAVESLVWARPIPEVRVPPPEALAAKDLSFDRFQVIEERNLFGTLSFGPAPVEVEEEEIAESKLPLKLLGTVVTDPPLFSSATVENEKTREHLVVRVKDRVAGAEVVRIDRKRIVVENRGEIEAITLEPEEAAAAEPQRTTAEERRRARIASRRTRARTTRPTTLTDRVRELGRSARETQPEAAQGRPPDPILGQARMLPSYGEDGQLEGLKVSNIRGGSALEAAGFQNGDIIRVVNGTEIASPTQGLRMLRNLGKEDRFNVEVDRAGEPVTLEYTPEEP
jgi:type II secretion system protein C